MRREQDNNTRTAPYCTQEGKHKLGGTKYT